MSRRRERELQQSNRLVMNATVFRMFIRKQCSDPGSVSELLNLDDCEGLIKNNTEMSAVWSHWPACQFKQLYA